MHCWEDAEISRLTERKDTHHGDAIATYTEPQKALW